jgi:hypothetical protein
VVRRERPRLPSEYERPDLVAAPFAPCPAASAAGS